MSVEEHKREAVEAHYSVSNAFPTEAVQLIAHGVLWVAPQREWMETSALERMLRKHQQAASYQRTAKERVKRNLANV